MNGDLRTMTHADIGPGTTITVDQLAGTARVDFNTRLTLFFADRADLERLHDAIGAHLGRDSGDRR